MPPNLSVSVSMGLASVGMNKPDHADQLVSFADESLYAAKRAGKDRLVVSQANTLLSWT
jgi:PleD family two-component response regulator